MDDGHKIIILSDHPSIRGGNVAPIPSLLATAAVNRALVKSGKRPSVGLIVQSGEVREVMHYALLLGFGATAVNPYLALETVSSFAKEDMVKAASNYVTAVDKGLLKIMSKMGISTLRSYRSAQIFEAVGLSRKLVRDYFGGVTSPVDGIGLDEIAEAANRRAAVKPMEVALPVGGEYRVRKEGENHLWSPSGLANFRLSVRANDYALFRKYTDEIDDPKAKSITLRSQFKFKSTKPIPIDQVESVESIVKHFVGGAMSLGSLSPEAHETIALALNGLGTMSNCGEGGENVERFGTDKNCGIKQVASGRFGVTINYLRNAKDLQIKLAQGAKPGEGGQLPAHKVNADARRCSFFSLTQKRSASPPPASSIGLSSASCAVRTRRKVSYGVWPDITETSPVWRCPRARSSSPSASSKEPSVNTQRVSLTWFAVSFT